MIFNSLLFLSLFLMLLVLVVLVLLISLVSLLLLLLLIMVWIWGYYYCFEYWIIIVIFIIMSLLRLSWLLSLMWFVYKWFILMKNSYSLFFCCILKIYIQDICFGLMLFWSQQEWNFKQCWLILFWLHIFTLKWYFPCIILGVNSLFVNMTWKTLFHFIVKLK